VRFRSKSFTDARNLLSIIEWDRSSNQQKPVPTQYDCVQAALKRRSGNDHVTGLLEGFHLTIEVPCIVAHRKYEQTVSALLSDLNRRFLTYGPTLFLSLRDTFSCCGAHPSPSTWTHDDRVSHARDSLIALPIPERRDGSIDAVAFSFKKLDDLLPVQTVVLS
jgi:hypothetical protein